jgi:hypothetical protein
MAGARTQLNGPVNGLTSTRVAQDASVDINQEVWVDVDFRSFFLSFFLPFFSPLPPSNVHFTAAASPSPQIIVGAFEHVRLYQRS